jgi:hypothetical protein
MKKLILTTLICLLLFNSAYAITLKELIKTCYTPEQLGSWIKDNVEYTREKKGEDYWQTPEEMLANFNSKGKVVGDCEDTAILAWEVLNNHGVEAYYLGSIRYNELTDVTQVHACCAFIHKGRWHYIDSFGLHRAKVAENLVQLGEEIMGARFVKIGVYKYPLEKCTKIQKSKYFSFEDGK